MKKNVFIVLFCLFAFGAMAQDGAKTKEKNKVTFSVPMDGQCCIDDITKTIGFEKGVKALDCNLEKKTVTITYRADQTTVDKLQKGLVDMGYSDVAVVKNEAPQTPQKEK